MQPVFEQVRPTQQLIANLYRHRQEGVHPVPIHWHPDLELFWYRSTPVRFFCGGRTVLLPAGTPVLLFGGEIHGLEPVEQAAPSGLSVLWPHSFLSQAVPGYARLGGPSGPVQSERLTALLQQLLEVCDGEQTPLTPLLQNAHLYGLLHYLLSTYAAPQAAMPPSKSLQHCRSALSYMQQHFRSPITLESTARHVGVSAEHLSRLLRRCLGLGFRQQLRDLRLDRATSQMAGWQQGLLQICLAAGFPDYRAFCAAFKERYGLTPRQYQSRL